jgi:hypothetical protein
MKLFDFLRWKERHAATQDEKLQAHLQRLSIERSRQQASLLRKIGDR